MPARRRSSETAQLTLTGPQFRRLVDGKLSEKKWQLQVERALDAYGWWWNHNPPNVIVCSRCRHRNYRGIEKGVPDIWAIKVPYVIYLELKTERGAIKPEQKQVLAMLRACGLTAFHARPRDRERVLELIEHPEKVARAREDI